MKILTTLLLLIFSLTFFSCKKEPVNTINYKFEITDSLKLAVPNYASIDRATVFNFENETLNLLYFLVANRSEEYTEFIVYDLNKQSVLKKIKFPYGGENLFPPIHGLTIKNPDSLYVTNYYDTNIYLYNSKPELLKKYSYKYETENQIIEKLFSNTRLHKKIEIFNDKVHFSPRVYKRSSENNQSLAFQLNLKNNELINLDFKFPNNYFNSEVFTHVLSREYDGENFIYAPLKSHELWITDVNHNNIETKKIESDYFRQFTVESENDDIQKSVFNSVYNSSYGPIVFDKYRNIYYRFFYPGIDVQKDEKELGFMSLNKSYFTVIVLDENLNKITEIEMPKDSYDMGVFFVNSKGLNISTNHRNSKTLDEDFLKFHTLKMKKI